MSFLHVFRPARIATFALLAHLPITTVMGQVEAVTQPSRDLSLGFTINSRVVAVHAVEGQHVEAGQALAELDDRAIRAQIDLLRIRAESDLEIKANEAELRLAQNEQRRVQEAFEEDAASSFEVERAALTTTRAEIRLELARLEREEARMRLQQALVANEELTLRAPTAGVIELVAIETGELVQQSRPVIRLVVTDPLRIDAPVPTGRTLNLEPGQEIPITLDIPQFDTPATARIVSIASVADPASDTRLVRLELPNPDMTTPAGMGCTLLFEDGVAAGQ